MPLPTIPSGNVASATAGGFEVANSCRFNYPDDPYMSRTPAGAGNQKTFTISFWCKRGHLGSPGHQMLSYLQSGSTPRSEIFFNASDKLLCGINPSGSTWLELTSTEVFRDVAAWYHICIAYDTTQGVEANRVKLYINGVQSTWASGSYPTLNLDTGWNNTWIHTVGRYESGGSSEYDGYLAEVVMVDGSALAPTSFGEFDEDSPTIWKPINVSGLTFGTNGFYLDFEDSANLGNDASGGTDFTEANLAATDQATDTPTNNFCVMNPLDNYYFGGTFSEGNCQVVSSSSPDTYCTSTLGVSAGKWYMETEFDAGGATSNKLGIADKVSTSTTLAAGDFTASASVRSNDGTGAIDGSGFTWTGWTTGDVISIALDLTNNKFYMAKNGTWMNSADPAAGSNGGTITAAASSTSGAYFFGFGDNHSSDTATYKFNFGGCSAFTVSSANSDGNGYGNFEYAPPSGYLAICTKNLGSDGG